MRLIDADALFEVLKGEEEYLDGEGLESRADGIRDAIMDVISAPTIEPVNVTIDEDLLARAIEHRRKSEERKKGKWIEKDVTCIDDELDDRNVIDEWQAAKCSVCGKWHTTPYLYSFKKYAYCPNCGADMRGKQHETD